MTPGPWKWWTSNSWKRLKRDDHGIMQNVLEPYVCRDGHPDVSVSEADMRLIAAAPDLLEALRPFALWADSMYALKDSDKVCGIYVRHFREAARIANMLDDIGCDADKA